MNENDSIKIKAHENMHVKTTRNIL